MSQPSPVNVLSDDDEEESEHLNDVVSNPFAFHSKRRRTEFDSNPTTVFVIDDDPTPPRKPSGSTSVPSFSAEVESDHKFSGISGLICLESDNESVNVSGAGTKKQNAMPLATSEVEIISEFSSRLTGCTFSLGNSNMAQVCGDSSLDPFYSEYDIPQAPDFSVEEMEEMQPMVDVLRSNGKSKDKANKNKIMDESKGKQRTTKEERLTLMEEKRQQKEQEKLQKAALKAEALEMKKVQKEKQKWEKGKFALKSIVAEIDTKVVELGSVGGHLLTTFAQRGISYRITSNPIERSIVWSMDVPKEISQLSSGGIEIPYVLLVYEADEFCDLVENEFLMDHVSSVQSHYPTHTVCYLTNKLFSYINKREQGWYKDPTKYSGWKRPPVEEMLSKLTTHFSKVHSRQCIDEAELAEHVVGLTCSLASCQFRKKLTRLSVYANGSFVPKDCVDKTLIKKNLWLKALVAIPKVQPRFAIAIWKKYPTMKSLLSVYMDPSKSVHEKEFLLKDLTTEVLLGEDRRLGEICSKRVYRILMAQCGNAKADDVEDGADFFRSQSP